MAWPKFGKSKNKKVTYEKEFDKKPKRRSAFPVTNKHKIKVLVAINSCIIIILALTSDLTHSLLLMYGSIHLSYWVLKKFKMVKQK